MFIRIFQVDNSMVQKEGVREPKQERGRRRVELILNAAAEVFAEIGYEATTTIKIAERAKISVGSLYQFFPNKDAIVRALVERYVGQVRVWFEAMPVEQFVAFALPDMVAALVNSMREFTRQNRDFLRLFSDSQSSSFLEDTIQPIDDEIYRQFDAIFAIRCPELTTHERLRYHLVTLAGGVFARIGPRRGLRGTANRTHPLPCSHHGYGRASGFDASTESIRFTGALMDSS
jgi:AcrR family transcriptional regulator